MRAKHWLILFALVALWGSSYLMVEIALAVWRPEQLAGLRIMTAAIVLFAALFWRGDRLPRDLKSWGYFLAIALIGNCLPFYLISWGQQEVESGLAGILAASTPLAVLILAHFTLIDERLSVRQLLGFVSGFAGIVVLMGPDSIAALGGSTSRLLSQLAIFAGAICYAVATVTARAMPATPPLVAAAGVILLAAAVMGPYSIAGARLLGSISWQTGAAIGFLGLFGTGLASILYFHLIAETSARFTSLLNYLVPVWAVGLGAWVLDEKLPLNSWLALALIFLGLILASQSTSIMTRPKH
jgi:drug/metabolite transporter (DMT)-like permease